MLFTSFGAGCLTPSIQRRDDIKLWFIRRNDQLWSETQMFFYQWSILTVLTSARLYVNMEDFLYRGGGGDNEDLFDQEYWPVVNLWNDRINVGVEEKVNVGSCLTSCHRHIVQMCKSLRLIQNKTLFTSAVNVKTARSAVNIFLSRHGAHTRSKSWWITGLQRAPPF